MPINEVNRLTTLTDEASQNYTFGYDIANRLTTKTLPNGVATSYNYDGMNRLTRLQHQGSSTLTDNNYTYNAANQISNIAELSQTRTFGYDNVNRLTSVTGSNSENYAFDSVGNRTSSSQSPTYNYQPYNRVSNTNTANYTYNANGTMMSKAEGKDLWRYSWDYENRLFEAATRKQKIRYKYDALGRRIRRYFVGNKDNTKFTYDGEDVILDDNNGVITKYQNGRGIDNKLKLTSNGVSKYFIQDHLGSTTALTNSSGSVVESASYDSFGNSANNLSTRYQFTGREYDNFTGLHYYRARFYDAKLGRFISEDPIGFGGGDVNLFGYVGNNPQNYVDPSGKFSFLYHYYFGGGSSVDLGQVGLGSSFENSSSVSGKVSNFNSILLNGAKGLAPVLCRMGKKQDTFYLSNSIGTDVTYVSGLFSVGRSTFFRSAQCTITVDCCSRTLRLNCSNRYSIKDKFKDPVDIGQTGRKFYSSFPDVEVGGTPYDINYTFNRNFQATSSF